MAEPLSATIAAVYDKAVASEPAPAAPSAPAPQEARATPSPAAPSEATNERAPEAQGTQSPESERPAGQRGRDPSGRFTKTDGSQPAPAEDGAAPATQPAATAPSTALKAPGRFKPEARELWAQVPPVLQQEIKRLEVETRKEVETSAQARRFADEFQATVQPYTPLFTRAPLEEVKGLLETARVLKTAPPAQRAAMVAQILRTFDVDPNLVADAWEGKAPAQGQQPQGEFRDPRVDALLAKQQQLTERKQQELRAKAAEELAEFQASEPEFFEDVRPTMAALMAAAHEQGQKPTLAEVYEAACLANATVRPLYQKRQSAIAAATASPALSQGKASASLRHEPSIPAPSKPRSLNDDIAANYDALTRRR